MKNTPETPQPDSFQTLCRERGLRVTPQRTAIYEELCRSGNHPTAEQVHARVRRRLPSISLNTVNETLLTFSRANMVDIVEGFGSPRRYDPNRTLHHHVHCVKCGGILDFENAAFDRLKAPPEIERAYSIINTKVVLTGICSKCLKDNI